MFQIDWNICEFSSGGKLAVIKPSQYFRLGKSYSSSTQIVCGETELIAQTGNALVIMLG